MPRPDDSQEVGVVTALNLFPIKSCCPIPLEEVYCTNLGVKHSSAPSRDRQFMVVREDGHMITARQQPSLVLVKPSIHGDKLHLDAPGMDTLKLPVEPKKTTSSEVGECKVFGDKLPGLDMGAEARAWFSKYIKCPDTRLVCSTDSMPKREMLKIGGNIWYETARPHDAIIFADALPYLLLSEASVEDLNSRLLERKIAALNFRPNIVVKGCAQYDENKWDKVYIGEAEFTNQKPCDRCLFTTIDPKTGVRRDDGEPLKTLRSYRINPEVSKTAPIFGAHLVIDKEGPIKVGDPVYATHKPPSTAPETLGQHCRRSLPAQD